MSKTNEHHTEHHTHAKDHASGGFASDVETLQNGFTQLRDDVTKLMESAAGAARHGADAVKHRAASAVDDLKDRGNDSLEAMGETIGEQPILSTAIAFGVGFVLGKMLCGK